MMFCVEAIDGPRRRPAAASPRSAAAAERGYRP